MSPVPEDPTPWTRLGEDLAGSFTARSRGLLARDFAILDRGGARIGRLRLDGPEGAELEAGDLKARIESSGRWRHALLTGAARVLASEAATTPTTLRITCLDRHYEARLSLLRNTAVAHAEGGEEVVARLTGGLTNRGYEATFDTGDEGSLPVAFFLLYRLVALRREAYRT